MPRQKCMICRVGGGEHESRRAEAQRCDLRSNRLAMVDDLMGAEILDQLVVSRLRACDLASVSEQEARCKIISNLVSHFPTARHESSVCWNRIGRSLDGFCYWDR
jgi:hypothetical protein